MPLRTELTGPAFTALTAEQNKNGHEAPAGVLGRLEHRPRHAGAEGSVLARAQTRISP